MWKTFTSTTLSKTGAPAAGTNIGCAEPPAHLKRGYETQLLRDITLHLTTSQVFFTLNMFFVIFVIHVSYCCNLRTWFVTQDCLHACIAIEC